MGLGLPIGDSQAPDDVLGWRNMLGAVLGTIWAILTFPFRVIGWIIEIFGRLTGFVLGFALMVVGVALGASPLFIIGIPLFIVGLVLTLRSLG
jgi:hypothetical protein